MGSHSHVEHSAYGSPETSDHVRRGGNAVAISARHQLLSDSWTANVEALEEAVGRFSTDEEIDYAAGRVVESVKKLRALAPV